MRFSEQPLTAGEFTRYDLDDLQRAGLDLVLELDRLAHDAIGLQALPVEPLQLLARLNLLEARLTAIAETTSTTCHRVERAARLRRQLREQRGKPRDPEIWTATESVNRMAWQPMGDAPERPDEY